MFGTGSTGSVPALPPAVGVAPTLAVAATGASPAPVATNFTELSVQVGLSAETQKALLTAMDPSADASFPLKVLSQAKEADIEALVASVRLPGLIDSQGSGQTGPERNLSFLQANAVRLLFEEAKSIFAPVPPPAASSLALVPSSAQISPRRTVKHSLVLTQTDETLSERISENEHIDYLVKYGKHYGVGAKPLPDHEPTADQLSGLKAVLDDGQPPYVDFAIFVANQHRMLNRLKLMGLRLMEDGSYQKVEIKGPADFSIWKSCWKVFKNCMVMMNTIDLGILEEYQERLEEYHSTYGPGCWSILYQSDTRARGEQVCRIKLRLAEQDRSRAIQGLHPILDPLRPWNSVYRALLDDDVYWRRQFEKPADYVAMKLMAPDQTLGVDAQVAFSTVELNPQPKVTMQGGGRGGKQQQRQQQQAATLSSPGGGRKRKNGKGVHIANGSYTANRKGTPLCMAFQSGSCTAAGCTYAHQCASCLSPSHGAQHPTTCNNNTTAKRVNTGNSSGSGGNKGGKGKGKGKGGKRQQY